MMHERSGMSTSPADALHLHIGSLAQSSADLAPLQKAVDELAQLTAARAEREEKKRKADAAAAARAREARAQKAREAAEPAAYDTAVAGASSQQSMMADEDEAMVAALEEHFAQAPALAPLGYDAFDIERQVAGPGGTVVATVAASKGTRYVDYLATMRRGAGGACGRWRRWWRRSDGRDVT